MRLSTLVGVSGLEPEASWSRTKRDTKLRHTPSKVTLRLYNKQTTKSRFFLNFFQKKGLHSALHFDIIIERFRHGELSELVEGARLEIV